jgi:glycosyltransferase involved in cell wall biosynthesis
VRIALLVGGAPPNPTTGGGAVTAWTVMSQLVDFGHDVSVIVLTDPANGGDPRREELVRERGVPLVAVPSRAGEVFERLHGGVGARLRRTFRPPPETLYPTLIDRSAVRDAVAATGAEAAFVYHFESLAASRDLDVPRFAAVGDPPHLSALYHFRRSPSLRAIGRLQAQVRRQPRLLVEMLNECSAAGAFAAHHAEWLRRKGAERCEYLRTPVPDPGPTDRNEPEKPRILLVGHLKGAVTLEGLQRFATGVLPRLEDELGADGFEVRLVGGFDAPPKLGRALDRPSVRLLGHVEDAGPEFRSAHVMLVPNSITLGIRVRIITAFAHGCCIVTDRANTLGIPELAHESNALIADSPEGLARETLRALADGPLRARLGVAARETYERAFQPRIAVGRIADTLERIAGERSAAAVSM